MSRSDLINPTVWFIPNHPTIWNIQTVIKYGDYFEALRNTTVICILCSLLQTFSCILIGYGLARFKFRGRNIFFALAVQIGRAHV